MFELYGKGLYNVLKRDEFITLCEQLKQDDDKIGLLKVIRHQFDVSLHVAKVETENIFDGKNVDDVFTKLTQGVLRNPTAIELFEVCENLRSKGIMGTLQRLVSKYTDAKAETFSNLQSLDFSSLKMKSDGELNYPFRYDD